MGLVRANQADERPQVIASKPSSGVEIILQGYRHSVEWTAQLAGARALGRPIASSGFSISSSRSLPTLASQRCSGSTLGGGMD